MSSIASAPVRQLRPTLRSVDPARLAQVEKLREQVRLLERASPQRRSLETLPALQPLVNLQAGGVYEVDPHSAGSSLALGLLAGPSSAGEWGAVIGVPDFGAEAAAGLGVRLDRVLCVPEPGTNWLEVVAALIDVVTVLVVRPNGRVSEAIASKVAARLRSREAVLISLGHWPRAEMRLSASNPHWAGAGIGEGHLRSRSMTVEAHRHGTPKRSEEVWFPGKDLSISGTNPRWGQKATQKATGLSLQGVSA